MITDEIRKIDEKIHNLEGWLNTAYTEVDWIGNTLLICQKHGFNEHDTTEIVREVGYTILSVAPPEEFYDQIKNRTSLTDASIRILCEDLVKEVFTPIQVNIEIMEDLITTLLQKLSDERIREEKEEFQANHILIVPIKQKEGTDAVVNSSNDANTTPTWTDPYKEIPE